MASFYAVLLLSAAYGSARAADVQNNQAASSSQASSSGPPAQERPAGQPPAKGIDIYEYRIEGVQLLPQDAVEETVYPFLGPDRTVEDVERARAALEKVYNERGYQAIAVSIPPQHVKDGIVLLNVTEGRVGRLRVKGSRYFSLDRIKQEAPSLAEGTVPNFKAVTRDIIALNQIPDRRVTPTLRAGVAPGTVDVDLNVEDKLPLHASLELNNRYSQDTSELRLNATVRYDNLWQLGHSLTFGYQVAPENVDDASVYSLSYLARIPSAPWLSILGYGVRQNSNVSTLGGINVAGRGSILGFRAIATLPGDVGFYQSLQVGWDYKRFHENVILGGESNDSPVTYYPISVNYQVLWQPEKSETQLNLGLVFGARGLGSDLATFDAKRFKADGNFFILRGDLSRTQNLPADFQLFGKVQGQVADEPLVSSEELSVGGLDTVRGYLESEVLGDSGVTGTLELRSPSLSRFLVRKDAKANFINDWRVYSFLDGAKAWLHNPLPEQQDHFALASYGFGSRMRLADHVSGSVDLAFPLIGQSDTHANNTRLTFRVWSDF